MSGSEGIGFILAGKTMSMELVESVDRVSMKLLAYNKDDGIWTNCHDDEVNAVYIMIGIIHYG